MKAIIYSVPGELASSFAAANIRKLHHITLIAGTLNTSTIAFCKNKAAVVVYPPAKADQQTMKVFEAFGVRYLLSVNGYLTEIDLDAAKNLNISVDFLNNYFTDNAIEDIATQALKIIGILDSWDAACPDRT